MFCKLLHISFVVNYHVLSLPKYACNIKYLNVCMHACKPCQPWYLFFGCLMSFVFKNCWLQVSSCRLGLKLVLGCLIMSLVLENCWLVANSCRLGLKLVFWLPYVACMENCWLVICDIELPTMRQFWCTSDNFLTQTTYVANFVANVDPFH